MPAPQIYNAKYHDDWALSLALKGADNKEIAAAMGISERTVIRWSKKKNEAGEDVITTFGEALHLGKRIADAKVVRKLYEKTQGYDLEEKETVVDVDKNGNTKPVRVRTIKKHVPPDTMAIMYWLNNRNKESGEWSQTQNLKVSGNVQNLDLSKMTEDELRNLARLNGPQD